MKIDCYLSEGCASEGPLRKNLSLALDAEGMSAEAEVSFRRIEDAVARAIGLKGSPSILIDGRDIMPAEVAGFG